MASIAQAIASLEGLRRDLGDSDDLATSYARAVLDAAKRKASGRPTAQARMAASGLTASDGAILASGSTVVSGSGGSASLDALLWGAELGSSLFPQFGPRTGGAWLFPTLADPGPEPIAEGEDWLADMLRRVA